MNPEESDAKAVVDDLKEAATHDAETTQTSTEPTPAPELPLYNRLINDDEVRSLIDLSDEYLAAIGYTDHGIRHVGRVAMRGAKVVRAIGGDAHQQDLVACAGILHDIGNLIHRSEHDQSSALIAFDLLRSREFPLIDVAKICGAIGNHDEHKGEPVSNISAALIIADKTDVLRSRVRNTRKMHFDIHDRVNYAATRSVVKVELDKHLVTLLLEIDTEISSVMEYFEIFLTRMTMSRRASQYLNCDFRLIINDTILV
jgi:metal-dependent HD superfamily phosphatase/phosphodiesterase